LGLAKTENEMTLDEGVFSMSKTDEDNKQHLAVQPTAQRHTMSSLFFDRSRTPKHAFYGTESAAK
jgi:hypothetical protein